MANATVPKQMALLFPVARQLLPIFFDATAKTHTAVLVTRRGIAAHPYRVVAEGMKSGAVIATYAASLGLMPTTNGLLGVAVTMTDFDPTAVDAVNVRVYDRADVLLTASNLPFYVSTVKAVAAKPGVAMPRLTQVGTPAPNSTVYTHFFAMGTTDQGPPVTGVFYNDIYTMYGVTIVDGAKWVILFYFCPINDTSNPMLYTLEVTAGLDLTLVENITVA